MTRFEEIKEQFAKFRGSPFREHQEDIVRFAATSKKKFVIIEAPTGIGKTLCGMVMGKAMGRSIYTVHSKTLQTQTSQDFPGIPMLWGRNNYGCDLDPRLTADLCMGAAKCPCKDSCEYISAKRMAVFSGLCILNYHYLLTEINYVGQFADRDTIIIDEADSLESVLAGFVGVNLPASIVSRFNIEPPEYKTTSSPKSLNAWRKWAGLVSDRLQTEMKYLEQQYVGKESLTDRQAEAMKQVASLGSHVSKLLNFSQNIDNTWLYEERKAKHGVSYHFNPTWITEDMAEKFLWRHSDKFVLMSATFPYVPVLCKTLGIDPQEVEYRQYPSIFPVENRQIKYAVAANLVYKEMENEVPKAVAKVKEILAQHPDEKGLIHTVSYKLAKAVMAINNERLVTHDNDIDRAATIKLFKDSKSPLVLVSPSLERGVSLDDDLCRFIIWVKAPFLSLNDKLVNARIYGGTIGNIWYKSMMLLSIVQGCGRGVRSDTDYSTTYIIDEQIRKAISDSPAMVPKWFREAIW